MLRNLKVRRLIFSGSVCALVGVYSYFEATWFAGVALGVWAQDFVMDILNYLDS